MSRQLTILIPDDAYESLRWAAEDIHRTPEELAASAIAERFGPLSSVPAATLSRDARAFLRDVMRTRGHLVEPSSISPVQGMVALPPQGSQERAQLEQDVAEELSDALEQAGLSILDLVERR